MNATTACPFPLRWTPQQITDAVPLRLFELDLSIASGTHAGRAANQPRPRAWHSGYLRQRALPDLFRVHG